MSELLVKSDAMREVMRRCKAIAPRKEPVLIEGDSGTGKTAVARYIHEISGRNGEKPHIWGCGEMDSSTIASVLFGHVEGAYTDAKRPVKGIFQEANNSTVILDDIDYLPLEHQNKLLRILDDGTFRPLGAQDNTQKVNIRVIATTNKNLTHFAEIRRFLPDLLHRLRSWQLVIPPLRTRPDDIEELARHYLVTFQTEQAEQAGGEWYFSEEAMEMLRARQWPGNVRQLEAAVKNIALFCRGNRRPITSSQTFEVLNEFDGGSPSSEPYRNQMQMENDLLNLLNTHGWNVSLVARISGLSRTTIYKRINDNGWTKPGYMSSR